MESIGLLCKVAGFVFLKTALSSFIGAVPVMWLFGILHQKMPAVHAFGYGLSYAIVFLVITIALVVHLTVVGFDS